MLRVLVITTDKYLWALRPFAHMMRVYWSELQPVIVGGFTRPGFALPQSYTFHQISPNEYPVDKWSNALIKFLNEIPDEYFVMLMEDFWLNRTADIRGITTLYEYMLGNPDILRIDLTTDRLYAGGMRKFDTWGHYDLITAPGSAYQMSFQSGIWNKRLLLEVLRPDWSPWDVEIHGTTVLNNEYKDLHVLGTRQNPISYANVVNQGKWNKDQFETIDPMHRKMILDQGWVRP
jgi:hypothetical protein